MPTPTVTLRHYSDSFEAEIVRDRLATADIRAFVVGTDMATALSLGGAGTIKGVRIEVAPDDYDRAAETLRQDEQRRREAGDWICGRCEEPNEAAFELCWSCHKPRSEDDASVHRHFEADTAETSSPVGFGELEFRSDSTPPADNGNPYRPVLVDAKQRPAGSPQPEKPQFDSDELDEKVRSVVVAAMASVLLFPPLFSIYVMWRIHTLPTQSYDDPSRRKRIRLAWWIAVAGSLMGIAYIAVTIN